MCKICLLYGYLVIIMAFSEFQAANARDSCAVDIPTPSFVYTHVLSSNQSIKYIQFSAITIWFNATSHLWTQYFTSSFIKLLPDFPRVHPAIAAISYSFSTAILEASLVYLHSCILFSLQCSPRIYFCNAILFHHKNLIKAAAFERPASCCSISALCTDWKNRTLNKHSFGHLLPEKEPIGVRWGRNTEEWREFFLIA